MPWLLSTAGYGVLVQNTETSMFRLGDRSMPGAWRPRRPRLELRVFAGPRPSDALRRLTRHTGRQPAAAARWFHGPWFQPTGDENEQIEMVRRLRRGDVPASAVNTFLHYLPVRRPGGHPRPPAHPHGGAQARGRGRDHLLQPDGLRHLPAGLRPGAARPAR